MSDVLLTAAVLAASAALGYAVIRRIPPMLHTPLMSMTNAVSGVVLLGGLLLFATQTDRMERIIGGLALAAAAFNVVGGFVITHRMLGFFRKPSPSAGEDRSECRTG